MKWPVLQSFEEDVMMDSAFIRTGTISSIYQEEDRCGIPEKPVVLNIDVSLLCVN